MLLVGAVGKAQQAEKSSSPVRKSAKKNKRKRQPNAPQFVRPPASPTLVSTSSTTASVDAPSISPGAPVVGKQSVTVQSQPGGQKRNEPEITSSTITPAQSSVVVLRDLTTKRSGISAGVVKGQNTLVMPPPQTITEVEVPRQAEANISTPVDIGGTFVSSPAPAQNFPGENDEAIGGGASGTFTIPPDTMGAVGIDKIFTSLNNNIVIQDKSTGAKLNTTGLSAFWSSTGATNVFDPRVVYDPYNNRWIVAAVSNASSANSSVMIGVSQTSDPMGAFNLFRFVVGCAVGAPGCNGGGEWADFPMLGFNKNWVAVSTNTFTISGNTFLAGKILVLDYPSLRGGTTVATLITGASAEIGGFCLHPVTTLSSTEETLYFPTHISSAGAAYRLHSITGTPAAPSFNVDPANRTRPGGGWTQPGGDSLPQHCIPGVSIPTQTCPTTIRQIDPTDAFIRSNAIFRNGKIYYPQTIALPTGGITTSSRFAAQWTVLNTDGSFSDGGRVEDATATRINGGKHYAMPSIAVNKNNDVLIGFSEFESDDYVDAGYAFRLGTDPAGTLQDPIIYKEGEDYYSKTFSGARNRWGDYSHSVVDPINDRDLWTLQEYAQARVGSTGQGTNDSRWGTWWAKVVTPAGAGDLVISEFRLRGPSGANDEFIEIYNKTSAPITVATGDGSAGYAVAASDGVARFVIPNGTVIPAKGHYLGANSVAYSLSANAPADVTYTTDIPDNAGIALFSTSTPANFSPGTRLDAVGSTSEGNTLYKEGTGYSALTPFSIDYAFYRSFCPNNTGVFGTALGCVPGGGAVPKDSGNNAADFVFVDTNGTSVGAGQRLGAPGPENLAAPVERNSIPVVVLDSSTSASSVPNRLRDLADPSAAQGSIEFRRRVQNNTGTNITRLRFRVIDINTFPAPGGFADLRTRTSTTIVVAGINDAVTCSPSPAPCSVSVQGTTLEQPPTQPNGGAFNSTYSAGTITLGTPLPPGESINVRFLMGVQQTGNFRFFINVEALP
jgi:hypothetical protein